MSRRTKGILGDTLISGLLGIFISGLMKYLYDNNIILDTLIPATYTIENVMFVIIIFFVILGLAIGSSRR